MDARAIAARVRQIRESRGLTKIEAAVRGGWDAEAGRVQWHRVEDGDRMPTLDTLERVASALGVSIAVLLGEPASYIDHVGALNDDEAAMVADFLQAYRTRVKK